MGSGTANQEVSRGEGKNRKIAVRANVIQQNWVKRKVIPQILTWDKLPGVQVFFLMNQYFLPEVDYIGWKEAIFWFCWKKGRLYFFCFAFLFSLLFFNDLKARRIQNYVIFCCSPYCDIDFFGDCSFFKSHFWSPSFAFGLFFSPSSDIAYIELL